MWNDTNNMFIWHKPKNLSLTSMTPKLKDLKASL